MVCKTRAFAPALLVALLAGRTAFAQPAAGTTLGDPITAQSPAAPVTPPTLWPADQVQGPASTTPRSLPISAATGYVQAPADTGVVPQLWKVDPLGRGATLPMSCAPYNDRNGPLLDGYPLLDGGPTGIPGWVAGVELGVVVPHVVNQLFSPVTRASGVTDTVQLPTAQIDATVMPRFEFGYRLGQAWGEVLVSYQFLTGQATNFASGDVVPAFAPSGVSVTSRLNLNIFDLDYGSWEPLTVLGLEMKWRVGVRTLVEFNDSQANNGTLDQTTNNHYFGVGPHAMVDFRRPIQDTGLALFARAEAGFAFGQLDQYYDETVTTAGVSDFGQTHDRNYTQVTSLEFQAGVSWTPSSYPNFSVTAGYIFQNFFDMGTYAVGPTQREDLYINGGFLRAEWRY
jgi:hypothetical protein